LILCFLSNYPPIFDCIFKTPIMAISKKYLKTKPVCKVTFTIAAPQASTVMVSGDFNNWDTSTSLKKLKNGTFKATLDIPADNSYEFRYVVDGEWQNEADADSFIYNEYAATENGVLKL